MTNVLYTISTPSTAFLQGVIFNKLPGRKCSLNYSYEKGDSIVSEKLIFDGVESFKCTYYRACSIEMVDAYDRVVDTGKSDWLSEITRNLLSSGIEVNNLKHLRIYFDDGPCYEFICRSFQFVSKEEKNHPVNSVHPV